MRVFSILALFLIAVSCQFVSGKRVTGNGHVISQDKSAGSFNSVNVDGAVVVRVRQDASPSVRIEADENLMQYLEVFTKGNTLVIRTKKGYNLQPSKDVVAYIAAPSFSKIEAGGSCKIISESTLTGNDPLTVDMSGSCDIDMDVNLNEIRTTLAGSGSINLRGKANSFSAEVSGSGEINCFNLVTDNTSLDLSGSADAQVNANKQLNVSVSGAGSVEYKGTASVSQSISGSGSVKKVE